MEDTLRVCFKVNVLHLLVSLNPCCNGRYSQRLDKASVKASISFIVLILVVMEDTLRVCGR